MTRQTDIPVAANVLGTIGTVFGAFRIWTNWRSKRTDGLPATMMYLWSACGVPFGAYNVIENFNIPLQVQPQVFASLCLISWGQILVYGHKWPAWRAAAAGLAMALAFGGIEAALILTLRPKYNAGSEAASLVVGVVASVLLAGGLVPPYFEMYKRRGRVVGINWIFLAMDWSGAFFSLMALVAQNTFDVLGGVLYIICASLELGIFASHLIWRMRTRSIRKQAKADGKTFDDVLEEHRVAGQPFAFAERPLPSWLSASWWWAVVRGKRPASASASAAAADVDVEKGGAGSDGASGAAVEPAPAPAGGGIKEEQEGGGLAGEEKGSGQ